MQSKSTPKKSATTPDLFAAAMLGIAAAKKELEVGKETFAFSQQPLPDLGVKDSVNRPEISRRGHAKSLLDSTPSTASRSRREPNISPPALEDASPLLSEVPQSSAVALPGVVPPPRESQQLQRLPKGNRGNHTSADVWKEAIGAHPNSKLTRKMVAIAGRSFMDQRDAIGRHAEALELQYSDMHAMMGRLGQLEALVGAQGVATDLLLETASKSAQDAKKEKMNRTPCRELHFDHDPNGCGYNHDRWEERLAKLYGSQPSYSDSSQWHYYDVQGQSMGSANAWSSPQPTLHSPSPLSYTAQQSWVKPLEVPSPVAPLVSSKVPVSQPVSLIMQASAPSEGHPNGQLTAPVITPKP